MDQSKKKSMAFVAALLSMAFFVAGCNDSSNQSKTTAASDAATGAVSTAQTEDAVIVNGLELTVGQFSQKNMVDDGGKQHSVFTAHVTGKNVSGATKGLGAIDFVMKTADGKEQEVTADLSSFGNEIESTKTIEGDLYFSLDKKETPKAIAYKPADKVLYSWDIDK